MRPDKQLLLDEMQDKIENFGSFVIVGYEGLGAVLATDFRARIAETGGDFEVVRKRVFEKAAKEKGIVFNAKDYEGHVGVIFADEDSIATIKAVYNFSNDNSNIFNVLGGQIDGTLYSAENIKKLSELPGKDEMRAQLLGLLEAPMSQTLAVMEALLTSILHCLENKVQKGQDSK